MREREREVLEKKIEINASGLMKGRQDHQLLMEMGLLRRRETGLIPESLGRRLHFGGVRG